MARPRSDGTPARQPIKRKFTDAFIDGLKPDARLLTVYDTHQRGLALTIQPKSGKKTWKTIYFAPGGRPRWYHVGAADAIGLADARKIAAGVMLRAAMGEDPVALRKVERSRDTFQELAEQYVEQHAKKKNKSWRQADSLARRYLLPKWAKLQASAVTRTDAKAMMTSIKAPVLANQVLAAASAIFAWGVKEEIVTANPCRLVAKNATKSRERVLSNSEIPVFWKAFDSAGLIASTALKLVLLTGQRPGEVRHMRREHVRDGWWELPGEPVPGLDWPGTKNGQSHRVWLSKPAQELLAEIDGEGSVFDYPRLDDAMRRICAALKLDRATPHDLRRTNGTTITGLGFGRDAMNRIQNHREGGIASVYDRHQYADENKRIMEAVATRIMTLTEGKEIDNVVELRKSKK